MGSSEFAIWDPPPVWAPSPALDALIARLHDEAWAEQEQAQQIQAEATARAAETAEMLAQWEQETQKISPRPRGWDGFVGNARAVETIREAIEAARRQKRALPHMLIFSGPGAGKTTLSQLMADDIGGMLISTTASTLETAADVLRLCNRLNQGRRETGKPSILFVDEIHMLGKAKGRMSIDEESVLPLLEDWRFAHNMVGKPYQDPTSPTGQWIERDSILKVMPFSLIGATTDPGALSDALRRRFLIHVELEPYSVDEIAHIIAGSAERLGWPIEPEAAAQLAQYARRNPAQGVRLLTSARNRAVATSRETISADVAVQVVERLNLYPLGLGATDVRILQILAGRPKGVGMAEIARAAGITVSHFSMLEPYLRLLNFTITMHRRVITEEGKAYLESIGKGAA